MNLSAQSLLSTPPLPEASAPLHILRRQSLLQDYPELKDPSIVKHPSGFYVMYASIGTSVTETWTVGRFISTHPDGTWYELSPVDFEDISGPQLCAPAVIYNPSDPYPWAMYIQTACFEENGVIVKLISKDGKRFKKGMTGPLIQNDSLKHITTSVVGVYDAGISEVQVMDETILCMPFSAYRKVGCGDLYLTYKHKNAPDEAWHEPIRLFQQEEIPFHNNPLHPEFEWGLEGATITQLSPSLFIMLGVCFLDKPRSFTGHRQRVFIAAAESFHGKYTPVTIPFPVETGENGHPDAFIEGDTLWIIYQKRSGTGQPWTFQFAKYNVQSLVGNMKHALHAEQADNHLPQMMTAILPEQAHP